MIIQIRIHGHLQFRSHHHFRTRIHLDVVEQPLTSGGSRTRFLPNHEFEHQLSLFRSKRRNDDIIEIETFALPNIIRYRSISFPFRVRVIIEILQTTESRTTAFRHIVVGVSDSRPVRLIRPLEVYGTHLIRAIIPRHFADMVKIQRNVPYRQIIREIQRVKIQRHIFCVRLRQLQRTTTRRMVCRRVSHTRCRRRRHSRGFAILEALIQRLHHLSTRDKPGKHKNYSCQEKSQFHIITFYFFVNQLFVHHTPPLGRVQTKRKYTNFFLHTRKIYKKKPFLFRTLHFRGFIYKTAKRRFWVKL